MKKLITTAALLLVVTTTAAVSAETLRLSLGGSDAAVTDTGYDYLSDDNFLSMAQLGVDFSPVKGFWVGLEYDWAVKSSSAFPALDTTLDVDGLLVNARYEYDVLSFFSPYVQVGGGFYHFELDAEFGSETREDDAYAGTFIGLIGAEFHVPTSFMRRLFGINKRGWARDLTFGFMIEGGYRLVTNATFDNLVRPEPDKEPEPEDRPIETAPLSFGDVDLSGVIMRSALVVRF